MNLRNLKLVLLELLNQLRSVKLAIASSSLDNLSLLLEREVLPGKIRTDVLLEQGQDLIVGDGAWVGEVVDARLLVLGKEDGGGKEIVENCVGIGDVNYALVLCDLGDEIAGVEIIADRHAQAED